MELYKKLISTFLLLSFFSLSNLIAENINFIIPNKKLKAKTDIIKKDLQNKINNTCKKRNKECIFEIKSLYITAWESVIMIINNKTGKIIFTQEIEDMGNLEKIPKPVLDI